MLLFRKVYAMERKMHPNPPLRGAAAEPVGATVLASDLVSLLIGSDRLELRGFSRSEGQDLLPLWVPQASGLASVDRAHRKARMIRRIALVLAVWPSSA